jgi:hypothetical protein
MYLSRTVIFRLIFIIGLANAMARPILKDVNDIGFVDSLMSGFGISFIVWFAAYCSIDLLHQKKADPLSPLDIFVTFLILILLCIPSTIASWLVLAGFAAYCSFFVTKPHTKMRNASFIMLALSLRVPVSDVFLKLSADSLLQFDAFATLSVVQLIDESILRHGNILVGPQGHELLIMTGCASFTNISLAILLWFAVVRSYSLKWTASLNLHIIPLCIFVMGLNIFRLSMMSLSIEKYHFYHDELGADIINSAILVVALILSIISVHIANKSGRRAIHDL